jgi:prolyl-tRNA editing enzyme YbaK/EbsC (Cys-tRNA(Pro) deacylase)
VKGALDVHQELLAGDVPHEMVRLPTPVTHADELPRALGLVAGCLAVRCYTVTRRRGTAFAAVLVPAGTVPDPGALLDALDATAVRPATTAEVNASTDFAAGLVSAVALPASVEVIADAAVGVTDVVYTAVGEGGVALGVRTRDLLVAVGARVASLTAAPRPADVEYDTSRWADVVDLDARLLRRGTG